VSFGRDEYHTKTTFLTKINFWVNEIAETLHKSLEKSYSKC